MKLPTHPLASIRRSPITLLTTLSWLAFTSTSSANPASETPEQTIERLTGFSEVEITQITPHKIRIRHHEGGKTLSYDELPDSLRKRFGMTEEAARIAEKTESSSREENARLRARNHFLTSEASLVSGRVIKVLDTGVLVTDAIVHTDIIEPIVVEKWFYIDGPTTLNPTRSHRYRRVLSNETAPLDLVLQNLIFIKTPTENFFDGASIEATVWHYGNHDVTLDEQSLTVMAFTTDGDNAWRLKISR